jgi:hypothetical protein
MNAKVMENFAQTAFKQLPKLARWGIPGAILGNLFSQASVTPL